MTDNPYSAGQTDDREPSWPDVAAYCVLLAWWCIWVVAGWQLVSPIIEQWRRDREDVRFYIEAAKESRNKVRP